MKKNNYKSYYYYLYDWANSPFSTIVITFIFSSYFTNTISEDIITGTSLWGWTIALSGIFIAFFSPMLGFIADNKRNFSKIFLYISTIIVVICSFSLWFATNKINVYLFLTIILI